MIKSIAKQPTKPVTNKPKVNPGYNFNLYINALSEQNKTTKPIRQMRKPTGEVKTLNQQKLFIDLPPKFI
tara:strand:+ start:113 stop:322 length:210 start_codon:yes stop_codon:yes gene_type:complete